MHRDLQNKMTNIKRNIFAFHTDPMELIGYESHEMIPTILFDKIRDIHNSESRVTLMKQYQDVLGKDLDVAIRAAEIYKNSEIDNLWPVGGEVEMALLRSPKHRDEHLKYHIGSKLQKDPRYLDILGQLDPVFVAKYLGYLVKDNYYVDPDFKYKVLKMLSKNIAASIAYSARSTRRNTVIEPVLLRMSTDDWQDLIKNSPQLNHLSFTRHHGLTTSYKSAWEYYLSTLAFQDGRQAVSDAKADYGYET